MATLEERVAKLELEFDLFKSGQCIGKRNDTPVSLSAGQSVTLKSGERVTVARVCRKMFFDTTGKMRWNHTVALPLPQQPEVEAFALTCDAPASKSVSGMQTIYEPKGAAREYAPYSLNLYRGCSHGCTYCYAPACLRMSREQFAAVSPRHGVIAALQKYLKKFVPQETVPFCQTALTVAVRLLFIHK